VWAGIFAVLLTCAQSQQQLTHAAVAPSQGRGGVGGGGPPLDCPQQSLNYNDNLYAFWLGVCGASLVSPEQSVLNALQGLLMRQGVMSALIARI